MAGNAGGEGIPLLALTTQAGDGVLQPVGFRAEEGISETFHVQVDMVSTQPHIDADMLLHKPACLTVEQQHSGKRHFHGLMRNFAGVGRPIRGHWRYTAEIVPRLWFMGQTTDCRVFQNRAAADIVKDLCGEVEQAIQLKIYGQRPVREYTTQYNETDLQFVLRLLEEEGYHFHFLHTTSQHTLVVTDQNQGFPASPKPKLHVIHEGGNVDTLTEWRRRHATAHGKVMLRDYDPAQPSTKPSGQQATVLKTQGAPKRDVFHWPAQRLTSARATSRARVMMDAAEAASAVHQGVGENHMFAAGGRFTLAKDPFNQAANVEYVLQHISHDGRDESAFAGTAKPEYHNRFRAVPFSTPWRQPITTPRPSMPGVYAGIVLGPKGEEIHADKLGRVKVQLFFDHRAETSADKAVWARVMQPWAGNTWGWQHLPRVGTEVAIGFMDGDPDRPVVLGGLYNGEMKPVFPIPAEQTKSGMRTRSTKHGGSNTFSEFSFDDKKGAEKVLLHAERDLTVEVEHDQMLTVHRNRTRTVKKKETTHVGDGQTNTIKNSRTTTVSTGDDTLTVDMGDLKVKASKGAIAMEAMMSITLKVGQNVVTIDQKGVTVTGMVVTVEGKTKTEVKAPMTDVKGDAMLTLKGALMQLN